ncbi:unnamed protein product [Rangifer tarandus platyrhynchus]|uniref:Uncharacterized protein n=2 Tax=Rangifer tarandus platyrhynchus TaxID=3082113 RepID=A0AC59YMT1_RANTA|nr:unnamed protein product [Rangifer tarandus platyrhynchus]
MRLYIHPSGEPVTCEINPGRQAGQRGGREALPGLGRGVGGTEQQSPSSPSTLRKRCREVAPHLSSGFSGLASGTDKWLKPCLSTARWSLESLIYLLVNQFLCVRSKAVGRCPCTCCST